ncbi:MAG: hypothetical protein AAGE43_11435, partial [Pseudomonadota bacterium]
GGTIYGDIPPAEFGHSLDAGAGRLIPSMSVEQFGANFAGWLGLNEARIGAVFPNLSSFSTRPYFML